MSRKTSSPSILKDPAAYRKVEGLNQTEFWPLFGVTQSAGSRYESGRAMPIPLKILLSMYDKGVVSAEDIEKARKLAKAR